MSKTFRFGENRHTIKFIFDSEEVEVIGFSYSFTAKLDVYVMSDSWIELNGLVSIKFDKFSFKLDKDPSYMDEDPTKIRDSVFVDYLAWKEFLTYIKELEAQRKKDEF